MKPANPAPLEALGRAMAVSQRAAVPRAVAAGLLALVFGFYIGWFVVGVWLGLYLSIQLANHLAFGVERPMTPGRARLALTLTALSSAVFGSFALAAPLVSGPWGVACAGWLLAGTMSYVAFAFLGSRALFYAALTPFAAMGFILAIQARLVGAPWANVVALLMAHLMGVAVVIALWRSAARVREAEFLAQQESERRRIEAESAVATKNAFIAVVSHELRTPISAILAGSADLQKNLSGIDAGKARLIGEAGAMMRTLLNDLLDKAKMDAGKMSLEAIPFDIREVVAHQLAFWRAEAQRKGLRLKLAGASGLPRWVVGDPTRIRQILNNLLSNALKFTEAGHVALEISAAPRGGACALRFTVRDTGPGLSQEAQGRLFNAFEQASTSTSRGFGGTGLGLAISRDLAELMGGGLTVRSELGHGAAFTLALNLPLAQAQAQSAAPSEAELPPIRILVVDDHEVNRRAMALILEPLGVDIAYAASGFEALSMLEFERFDVVLMDRYMPGMDGRQATRELRAVEGINQDTPVIAVTGSTEDADIAACRDAGMNAHVPKPIDPTRLIGAIVGVLDESSALAA